MDVLTGLNRQGITTIIVTHEASVSNSTNRIIHLKDGMIEYETRKNNGGVHESLQPAGTDTI